MLLSYQFVKAEQDYRRDRLRVAYQNKIGVAGKAVVAAALAAVLFVACGSVVADQGVPVASHHVSVAAAGPR